MSRDREHVIGNQSPKAVIYFVDKDWSLRKGGKDPKIITPDIADVLELRASRGTTGHSGNFTLVLNNKDNKYFTKDNIEDEIKQLNILDTRKTPEIKEKDELYGKDPYPYANAKDFLDAKEITQRYATKDNPYGEHEPGVDVSFILEFDEEGNLGYYNIPAQEMEDNEISQVNASKYWVPLPTDFQKQLTDEAKKNSEFFMEHGGDLNQGRCVFEPMQRIVIQLSRRFPNKESELQTVFTGLVSSVSDSYQENLYTINIQGEDLTKWLRVTQINMNPSFVRVSDLPESGDFLLTQHKFSDMEGWQIIQTLILGGKTQAQQEFGGLGRYTAVKESTLGPDKQPMRGKPSEDDFQEITPVGMPGEWIGPGKSGKEQILKDDKLHLQVYHGVTAKRDGGTHIITPYKLFFRRSANTFDNEYSTVWDVITDVAKLTNFEFYADAYGDLWYHQPRFNNYHILNAVNQGVNPEVYVIRDEDILSHDFTESDENIITSMFVTGMQDFIEDFPIPLGLANFYEDFSFVRKYGRRFLFTHHPYVRTKQDCWYFAKSLMQRINAERFTGQITILGRPEINLAMPIYIAYKNTIYYIKEVTHNFSFGGQFTTTLQLTYGRKPWEILPEVLDYKTIPPQLASKELEKYYSISELPIGRGYLITPRTPSVDDFYVLGSNKGKYQDQELVDWVGPGYLLRARKTTQITAKEPPHIDGAGNILQAKYVEKKHQDRIFAHATITGNVVAVMPEQGAVKIQGIGDDTLFEVSYVGLSGEHYNKLVRGLAQYNLVMQSAGDDVVKQNAAALTLPSVKAGTVIGEVTYTSPGVKSPGSTWLQRVVTLGHQMTQPYLLYYAIKRNGVPVYPNEVHTAKFLAENYEVWDDTQENKV